jgi:ABC-2 type transport system ATP-binding protein
MHAARAESAPPVPAIALSGVSAGYGRLVAARGVSLAVHAGETLGLIGLNGAGKTTLIKAIAGLRGVQAGTIAVAGAAPGGARARAALAYLPERFEPPWFLTGLEFLRFSTRLYGLALPRARFEAEATRIDLAPEALARRTGTYSKGMRQKLGLLATLLTERQTLLLDEPMSGLDPIARATTKALLRDARGAGRTVLLSSHILADMDEICDRVAVLHDREIRFVGTPADLRAAGGGGSLEQAFLRFIREGGSVGGDESA